MTRHLWTGQELRYLIENYPNKPTVVIAEFLNIPLISVYSKAYYIGLTKSDAYKESELSGRYRGSVEAGKPYRFKKGHVPANKGKNMSPEQYKACKATMFKKGHAPHNTKQDGYISIRIDKHGRPYAHIRIARGKFDLLHRQIWINNFGPIPKGMIVSFKNNDTADLRPENLELITRAENMKRNTRHNYPDDLQSAIIALNKLKKYIKDNEQK